MSGESIKSFSQQLNPVTGDIQFNPANWGLTMRDIEAASLNVKTAIYSGNVNLTADFYQQVQDLSYQKYSSILPDGKMSSTGIEAYLIETGKALDSTMTWKDPGLYMDHQRVGFWDGDEWKAWIGNTGDFSFDGDLNNFIRWDGNTLIIQGTLQLGDGSPVASILDGLGDMAYENLVEFAKLGTTVITGGFIKTSLINAGAILIGSLSGAGALASMSSIDYTSATLTNKPTLGSLASASAVSAAMLDTTLIVGGYLKTTLIETATLFAQNIAVTGQLYGNKATYASTVAGFWLGNDASVYKFNIGDATSYLKWNGSTLEVRGNIQATSATFNYAGSSSAGGSANDTALVNGVSASTVATGGQRAVNALNGSNRYAKWLSSWELEYGSNPSTGVIIDAVGIRWYHTGNLKFHISALDGSAFFKWDIYAVNGTFTGNITSSATITGWVIQSASSGARMEMSSTNGLRTFDSSGNVRLRMPTDGLGITFFDATWSSVGRIQWFTPLSGLFTGVSFINIDNNGTSWEGNLAVDNIFASNGHTYLSAGGTSYTTYCLGKFKLPVGTNLY